MQTSLANKTQFSRLSVELFCVLVLGFTSGSIAAQEITLDSPINQTGQAETTDRQNVQPSSVLRKPEKSKPDFDEDAISELLNSIARAHLPHTFEENKDWGKTSERWAGVKFRLEGLRLKTKRKKKTVNHGTWKKYSAKLIDPAEKFQITVRSLEKLEKGRVGFVIDVVANAKVFGRVSKWVKGVQLYSISAEARTKIQLTTKGWMGGKLDFSKLPPDLVFDAHFTDADIEIVEFKLDRVSKASGEVSQQIGKGVKSILEKQVEKKESKLVEKINSSIDKKKDKMRLSVSDLMKSKWSTVAQTMLEETSEDSADQAPSANKTPTSDRAPTAGRSGK